MPITFVGSQAEGWGGDPGPTAVTFSLAGGLAAVPEPDDFVLVTYSVGAQADQALTIDAPDSTDYTLVAPELVQASSARSNLRMAYRVMPDPAEPGVQFSGADWNFGSAVTIQVFRGVDPANPLDVAAVVAAAAGSRVVNPGAIEPVTPGAVIVVAGGAGTMGGTAGTYTSGELSGFVSAAGADNYDAMVGAGHYAWVSDAFDPAPFGGGGTDSTDDAWNAITIALRPAGQAAPTIDVHPVAQSAMAGGTATFTGVAHSNGGTGATWTWQMDDGSTITDVGSTPGAYTTGVLAENQNGYQVRFVYADSAGSVTSAWAALTVTPALPYFDPAYFDPAYFDTTQIGGGGTLNASASGTDTTAGQATPAVEAGPGATGADVTGGTAGAGVTVATGASGADQTGGSAVGSAGQILSGAASGADTTSGAAQAIAGISVAAVGVSTSAGSAGPTVAVAPSAVGIDVTGGSADRQVTVTISALGIVQSAAQAGVSVSVLAAAAAAAQTSGNATLAAQIAAIAQGIDQTAGSANGSATGASELPGSASGADTTSGSAVMTVSIQLQAQGADVTGGSATAGVGRAAAAQGADQTAGSATLSIDVAVTAAGIVQSAGVGYFEVSVPASAFGAGQTGGSANAAILNLNIDGPVWMTATVRRLTRLAALPGRATILTAGQRRLATFRSEVQRVH